MMIFEEVNKVIDYCRKLRASNKLMLDAIKEIKTIRAENKISTLEEMRVQYPMESSEQLNECINAQRWYLGVLLHMAESLTQFRLRNIWTASRRKGNIASPPQADGTVLKIRTIDEAPDLIKKTQEEVNEKE